MKTAVIFLTLFISLGLISAPEANLVPSSSRSSGPIHQWCSEVQHAFDQLKWKMEPCEEVNWQIGGESVEHRPLVYAEFGDLQAENTTLILSTVHGDEITPLYLGIQLVNWVKNRQSELGKTRVVIAPLVNPDGFFSFPKTRMNAHGVDINRNFATQDWTNRALVAWKKKFKSDPRRNPGKEPSSEPETLFQEELIRKIRPQKILTIHSPLNVRDWDGPNQFLLAQFPKEYVVECDRLRKKLKATSTGFFPGSLGNYAGHERGIPTLTLELPSADPKKADAYWKKFSQGIRTMIQHTLPAYASGTSHNESGS